MSSIIFKSVFLFLLFSCVSACADGRFFYRDKVPATIPYQRALLIHDAGKETIVLQSKYKTTRTDVNSIAWIVPVPSVPDLASMDAYAAMSNFLWLGRRSQPTFNPVLYIIIIIGSIGLVSFLVAKGLNALIVDQRPVSWIRIAIALIIVLFLLASIVMPSLSKERADVLKDATVGIYDVKVISADGAEKILNWLRDNHFSFDPADANVFEQYVKKRWCFVTAKVNRNADSNLPRFDVQGLTAPLIVRFDSKQLVYPMALTAAASDRTELLLYVLADHKVNCSANLKPAFAGRINVSPFYRPEAYNLEPAGFFDTLTKKENWYISKFKGVLTPPQMKDDIIFNSAPDDNPYRQTRYW
jgi:hypothetical protein